MTARVFISWSGERGRTIGLAIDRYLQKRAIPTFFSPNMPKGAEWRDTLRRNLKTCPIGLIVLTPESARSLWIAYEVGALDNSSNHTSESSSGETRSGATVCPIRIGDTDVPAHLQAWQYSDFEYADMNQLVKRIESEVLVRPNMPVQGLSREDWEKLHADARPALESPEPHPAASDAITRSELEALRAYDGSVDDKLFLLLNSFYAPAYFCRNDPPRFSISFANLAARQLFGIHLRPGQEIPLDEILKTNADKILEFDEVMSEILDEEQTIVATNDDYGTIVIRRTRLPFCHHGKCLGFVVTFHLLHVTNWPEYVKDHKKWSTIYLSDYTSEAANPQDEATTAGNGSDAREPSKHRAFRAEICKTRAEKERCRDFAYEVMEEAKYGLRDSMVAKRRFDDVEAFDYIACYDAERKLRGVFRFEVDCDLSRFRTLDEGVRDYEGRVADLGSYIHHDDDWEKLPIFYALCERALDFTRRRRVGGIYIQAHPDDIAFYAGLGYRTVDASFQEAGWGETQWQPMFLELDSYLAEWKQPNVRELWDDRGVRVDIWERLLT